MTEEIILQMIGQIEAGIKAIEKSDIITDEEFQDYCDNAYSCITYWRIELRSLKKEE